MKITRFFIAAFLSAAVMTSCSTQEIDTKTGDNSAVKISLNLKGAETKSVDGNVNDEDNVINDFVVFVVADDDNQILKTQFFTGSDIVGNAAPQIVSTVKAKKVYIIANTGSATVSPFKNVSSMTDVRKVAAAVDGLGASSCKSKNVWMSGSGSLTPNGNDGGTPPIQILETTVQLEYVAAKIHVIVVNEMTNFTSGNVCLDGVAVVNGGAWTGFVKASSPTFFKPNRTDITATNKVPFYYNGILVDPANYIDKPIQYGSNDDHASSKNIYKWAPAASFPMTKDNYTATPITPAFNEGFYVFPNITSNKTHVTIYGRYKNDGNAAALTSPNAYWSFHFDGEDKLCGPVENGYKYIVTITLKGNAIPGGNPEPDPTIDAAKAFVNVTVNKAQWKYKPINKVIE